MNRLLSGAFLVVLAATTAASAKEEVTYTVLSPNSAVWRIYDPAIAQPQKSYTRIKFEAGDKITLEAGGCDQTGGHGATWKRYVDPQGPNSDKLYHGLIRIPGATDSYPVQEGTKKLVRLSDLQMTNLSKGQFKGSFVVGDLSAVPEKDRYLRLGYQDDDYSDNGYWGRDDGTDDQCKDLGTAYVVITIVRAGNHPFAAAETATMKEGLKELVKPATKLTPAK